MELAKLEQQLAQRNQMLFGSSSERRMAGAAEEPPAKEEKKPRTGHGAREQPALPIEEELHDLDEADKACPSCGGHLQEWAGQFEQADEVDLIERRFVLRRHKRKKYRCACGGCVETAPGPLKLFPGARYSIAFVLAVATDKYLDHLPLERQVRAMARDGLVVDSQTLFDQCYALARLVEPAYRRLGECQREEALLLVDETRWPVFGKKGENAASRWHLWASVVGRKNHYGSRSRRGTELVAILYALFESAKLVGINPAAYMRSAVFAALRGQTIPLPHELVNAASDTS